jgi:hypothetical protein
MIVAANVTCVTNAPMWIPPPKADALFPAIVLRSTTEPGEGRNITTKVMPPPRRAVLPVIVLSEIDVGSPKTPPPASATFPEMVVRAMLVVDVYAQIPPPWPNGSARLSEIVLSTTVVNPRAAIPPPAPPNVPWAST